MGDFNENYFREKGVIPALYVYSIPNGGFHASADLIKQLLFGSNKQKSKSNPREGPCFYEFYDNLAIFWDSRLVSLLFPQYNILDLQHRLNQKGC